MSEPKTTRRQRRAAQEQGNINISTSTELPLEFPDRSGPKGESLLQQAAKRQAELDAAKDKSASSTAGGSGVSQPKITPTPIEPGLSGADGSSSSEPLANACMYGVTLSIVHFTLDVLVYHQYAQRIDWPSLFRRTGLILPSFGIIVYILHVNAIKRFRWPRQALFLGFACAAGCYLIRTGNEEAYIAVMKQAPPLGTLLIWSFVEMELPFGLVALLVVGGYMWKNGYTVI